MLHGPGRRFGSSEGCRVGVCANKIKINNNKFECDSPCLAGPSHDARLGPGVKGPRLRRSSCAHAVCAGSRELPVLRVCGGGA